MCGRGGDNRLVAFKTKDYGGGGDTAATNTFPRRALLLIAFSLYVVPPCFLFPAVYHSFPHTCLVPPLLPLSPPLSAFLPSPLIRPIADDGGDEGGHSMCLQYVGPALGGRRQYWTSLLPRQPVHDGRTLRFVTC